MKITQKISSALQVSFSRTRSVMLLAAALLVGSSATAQTYCTPTSACTSGDYINNFTTTNGLTNISNTNTACATGAYTFYSTMTHTATLGGTVNFSLSAGPSWSQTFIIWVDWNMNGSFLDAGEQMYTTGSAVLTASGSFTVPMTATPGTTRMRVSCNFSGSPTPCGSWTFGETEDYNFVVISPCSTVPTGLAVSNITSTTARLTWTQPTPSLYNEYVISTSATPPNTGTQTTTQQYNATGLTPNTQYYFHVRNQCNTTDKTVWVTLAFKTNPPCTPPTGIHVKDLSVESTKVLWRKISYALGYEYVLDLNRSAPTSTPYGLTTDTSIYADQLAEGTTYYIHIRTLCPGGEYSGWALDSFTTLILCRPPQLMVDYVSANRAVVYWNEVRTAVEYEYEISQSPAPLGKGTRLDKTSFLAFPLKDATAYYFHVRSNCVDQGRTSSSEWATTAFYTWPTSVANVTNDDLVMTVSPNPVKDILKVQLKGLANNATIYITDVAGHTVYTGQVQGKDMSIDMSNIATGMYFIRYADETHNNVLKINKL